jgi:hypothetical protein
MISECCTGCDQKKVKADLEKICEKWDALTLQAPALYLKEASCIRDADEPGRVFRLNAATAPV